MLSELSTPISALLLTGVRIDTSALKCYEFYIDEKACMFGAHGQEVRCDALVKSHCSTRVQTL